MNTPKPTLKLQALDFTPSPLARQQAYDIWLGQDRQNPQPRQKPVTIPDPPQRKTVKTGAYIKIWNR